MGLLSDTFRKKQEEEQLQRPPSANEMYDLGYDQDDEPSLMELFSRWTGHKIKQGRRKLAEVR